MDEAKRATLAGLTGTTILAAMPLRVRAERQQSEHDMLDARMDAYDPIWRSPSRNAGESMPCGAGDIGLNVWVEGEDLLFYVSRSGAFDETNSYLKLGRARLRFNPSPFQNGAPFEQRLRLATGEIVVICGNLVVSLWADVETPIVHIMVESITALAMTATWESWRTRDRDYLPAEMLMHRAYDGAPVTPRQYADEVKFAEGGVVSLHHNRSPSVFDLLVEQQELGEVKDQLWNPLAGLGFGALLRGNSFVPAGTAHGSYASTPFTGWSLASHRPRLRHELSLFCHVAQAPSRDEWFAGLRRMVASDPGAAASRLPFELDSALLITDSGPPVGLADFFQTASYSGADVIWAYRLSPILSDDRNVRGVA